MTWLIDVLMTYILVTKDQFNYSERWILSDNVLLFVLKSSPWHISMIRSVMMMAVYIDAETHLKTPFVTENLVCIENENTKKTRT